ncbi:hypothetical protein [uncultured Erythrobacter sp.]|uniref:hypothetical protein n=1 Tax=uncultured Erythrobacter sp. TaxID=263913 RepID=UPI002607E734|nr:hypothetical protein [uncultured Erythrobacter sp.]
MLISSVLTAGLLASVQAAPPVSAPEAPPAPERTADVTEVALAEPEASVVSEEPVVNDEDKIICRRTAIVGSRFKKRLCGTQKEWESMRQRSRDATQGMQRSGRGLEPDTGG